MPPLYKPRCSNSDSNMIPMINIVFLLLIFFMIAGQIKPITQPDIEIPVADIDKSLQISPLRVEMNNSNQLIMNGEVIQLETLQNQLSKYTGDEPEITLIADRRVLAADLNKVLELFRQHGRAKITLLTLQQDSY